MKWQIMIMANYEVVEVIALMQRLIENSHFSSKKHLADSFIK